MNTQEIMSREGEDRLQAAYSFLENAIDYCCGKAIDAGERIKSVITHEYALGPTSLIDLKEVREYNASVKAMSELSRLMDQMDGVTTPAESIC